MNSIQELKNWASFVSKIRNFFDSRGFCEVMTSNLVPVGAFEASLDPLTVSYSQGQMELHTSPEIAMKKVLAQSPIPIYQICKSYRDDPPSPIHFTEFTMLEFYQPHEDYRSILNLTIEMIQSLAPSDLIWKEFTIQDLWKNSVAIELKNYSNREDFAEIVERQQLCKISPTDSWEDIFFKVMLTHIEPRFVGEHPYVIRDYPPQLCTLLKVNEAVTERFEIYWKGMELCNGGTELIDVGILDTRYKEQSAQRMQAGKKPHPFPQVLREALIEMPPAAGVAVGLERLFRCLG